jgi:signal transduction histidine kinase
MQGSGLVRRFIILSLGLIGLMAGVLGWTTGEYLTRSMIEREKTVTADFVKHVVRMHFLPADLRAAGFSLADSERLSQVAKELREIQEVVRIKVFDHGGTIIWSDARDLIGRNFREDSLLQESLQGKLVVNLEPIGATPEHRFEYGKYKELTSIYVPIMDEASGDTFAVFEVYKLPGLLNTAIRQGRTVIWAIVLTGGVILFLGQFGLVRGAARTINAQYGQLRQRADELEEINTRLRTTRDQLVAAERLAAIGEVTAAVAHGIRNPLGNIRSVAQEAAEGLEHDHSLRQPLAEIMDQVDLLEARLRSFLSTTKSFDCSLTPTCMSTLVNNAFEGIRQRLAEEGVTTSVDIDAEQTSLCCDAVKIEEAFQELLVNCVDAGVHTIRVVGQRVSDDTQESGVRVTIEDDGPGLTSGTLEKAFEPFFTTKPLGTGLGLVVAKKIIEGHGGRLILEGRSLGGTKATVWLPSRPTNGKG